VSENRVTLTSKNIGVSVEIVLRDGVSTAGFGTPIILGLATRPWRGARAYQNREAATRYRAMSFVQRLQHRERRYWDRVRRTAFRSFWD
jgi:hypothetical protein